MPETLSGAPVIRLVPRGKVRCYIHDDVLRRDTPEEHVRQRVARSLVEEYGYAKENIRLAFSIKVGSDRKEVDIAIFPDGDGRFVQENISIIVETKRENVKPSDREEGIKQLRSYLSACLNARWGLWVGAEMHAYERRKDPKRPTREEIIEATDIPLSGEDEPRRKQFSELVPATDGLRNVFKRCHNYIHVNGDLGKEKAFFELLKLIFCKVYDEETTSGTMRFSIAQEERRSELGQRKLKARIDDIFQKVKEAYPYIFTSPSEGIELDNRSLAYVVSELEKYNFQETKSDIKGEAYEEIVSVTSRRDFGAFFTPRNVCDMAVQMLFATYPLDRLESLTILDPACGTGGFLRSVLLEMEAVVKSRVRAKWAGNEDRARRETASQLRTVCNRSIYGIDKLAELVRAAQMNLAMHGDGSTNVHQANSLAPFGEWSALARKHIRPGTFDVVFTNPPFGSKLPIDDPHILDQFELVRFEAPSGRATMPPEHLFIERCLGFLKPGGRMAIVLPDSILSNPGLGFIRRWLLQNAYVLASIDLPKQMFAKSNTGTLTSVLVVQKYTEEERKSFRRVGEQPDYEVFMSIVDEVGWDQRGNPVNVRTPTGEEVHRMEDRAVTSRNAKGEVIETVRTVEVPVPNDQLSFIPQLFRQWLSGLSRQEWMHG